MKLLLKSLLGGLGIEIFDVSKGQEIKLYKSSLVLEAVEPYKDEFSKPDNLVVSIEQYIVEQINRERWKQGDRIDDLLIAKELKVSRNSVRDALSRLTALKALEKQHWSGYNIPVLSKEQADMTLQIRIILEKYAMELFMARITTQHIVEIENSVNLSENSAMNGDFISFHKYDYAIHSIIKDNCGNLWVAHFLEQIGYMLVLLRQIELVENRVTYAMNSIAEHRKIIGAMKEGNAEQAVLYLVEHIEQQRIRLEKIFFTGEKP